MCPFFFSTKCPLLNHNSGLTAILCFHAKSEGLGDFSLLNNDMAWTSTSWLGCWESSGSLLEVWTTTGPLLLVVLGPLLLDSMLLLWPAVNGSIWRALHVYYSHKTAQLFLNYVFTDQLFQKLCWHIRLRPACVCACVRACVCVCVCYELDFI